MQPDRSYKWPVIFLVMTSGVLAYGLWCFGHTDLEVRISLDPSIRDGAYPRPFPYPDKWLLAWEEAYVDEDGLQPPWDEANGKVRAVVGAFCVGAAVLVLASVMFIFTRFVDRRDRRLANQCMNCGYDLQGSAAGAKCPECGEPRGAQASVPATAKR